MVKEDLHQGHATQNGFFGDTCRHLWELGRKVLVIIFQENMFLFICLFFEGLSYIRDLEQFFWLCWVFLTGHGLPLVAASRDYSPVVVHVLLVAAASHCIT